MFGNGTSEFITNMFYYKTIKSTLCDYCKEKNAIIDFYIQTPSYYRNKSNNHWFMCSQECYNNCLKYNVCHRCRYDSSLMYIPEMEYSLCDDYPSNISCYDREQIHKQFKDGTAICSFCKIKTEVPKKYYNPLYIERQITDDIILNICNKCNDTYEGIVLWNYHKLYPLQNNECVFCKTKDIVYTINRDDTCIQLCESCHINYKYLVTPTEK